MTQARQRHARFYLEYARANPEDWQWFDAEWLQIKRAWDNVCEDDALVLDYIETITDFMQIRGILQEVIEWTQRGLDAARVGKKEKTEALLLNTMGACYQKLGKHLQALEAYEKALLICRELGDISIEIRTVLNIGDDFYESGDLEKGLEIYQYAVKLAQEIGELGAEAVALNGIGLIFGLLGESEKALEAHIRALEIRRIQGDKRGQAACLNNIGCRYANTDNEAAKTYFEQALSLIREVGDRVQEASILHNLAVVNREAGNLPEAIKCFEQAIAVAHEVGLSRLLATALNSMGLIYHTLGQFDEALAVFERAYGIARQTGYRIIEGVVAYNIGLVDDDLGDVINAQKFYRHALEIFRETHYSAGEQEVLIQIEK
jgi:tetratricopeptide (TPR) repeat protein